MSGLPVALWSHYPGAWTQDRLRQVGTLDEPNRLPPDVHIYTSTRLPWLELPASARAFEEFYTSPAKIWTAESRYRVQAGEGSLARAAGRAADRDRRIALDPTLAARAACRWTA
jgi:hypothetical protein